MQLGEMSLFKTKQKQGSVLVELSLIVVVLMFIGLSGFEITSTLKYKRLASSISRELANAIYRDCSDINQQYSTTCVRRHVAEIYGFAQSVAPKSVVYVHLYMKYSLIDPNFDDVIIPHSLPQTLPSPAPAGGFVDGTLNVGTVPPYNQNQVTAAVQVWIPYRPSLPMIANALGLTEGYFSDATII